MCVGGGRGRGRELRLRITNYEFYRYCSTQIKSQKIDSFYSSYNGYIGLYSTCNAWQQNHLKMDNSILETAVVATELAVLFLQDPA